MKKNLYYFCLFVIGLLVLSPLGFSRENAGFESLANSIPQAEAFSNHFALTVTSDGQFIPTPGPVFTEGDEPGTELPYLVSKPKPISYPRWAVRQEWQGKLILAVEILPNGRVGRMKVMKSTGYRLLDRTATKAIQQWKFHPATKDGNPVLSCIQVPVEFRLQE